MGLNIHFVAFAGAAIGGGGTDAAHWVLSPDGKLVWQPGWDPEQMHDLARAVMILRSASLLKDHRVAEAVIKDALGFVEKQLAQHMKDGGVLVIG